MDELYDRIASEKWYLEEWTVLVMGASGDLAQKKTYPALFQLFQNKLLPPNTRICGFSRTAKSVLAFREQHLRPNLLLQADFNTLEAFLEICDYQQGKSYGDEEALIQQLRRQRTHNLLVYLAVPPTVFGEATNAIKTCMNNMPIHGYVRVVLEKPFGHDLASCKTLLSTLSRQGWSEDQLFRIDHYLGKEMAHQILTLRRYNSWIQSLWNRDCVQAVHFVFKENFGTVGRGGYFDQSGIIRDVLQNHLLQILALITMEIPEELTPTAVRDAKVQVLNSIDPLELQNCLLGQYSGYKDDPTILDKDTITPTYACIKAKVNNARWQGIPFIMEAGKALDERVCEVRLYFSGPGTNNALVLRIQPTPALFLTCVVKSPGFSQRSHVTRLGIEYETSNLIPEAYTRLLMDVFRGRQTNFVRDDELLAAWSIFTPLLHKIERERVSPDTYKPASSGPTRRDQFLKDMGLLESVDDLTSFQASSL